ncbi:TPA: glycosyltransferase [Aeromonas veronii]
MEFYYRHVDILVSIDTGVAFNGWPLGIEAALTGVLLATTDPNKIHHHYDIPSRSLVIFDPLNMSDILDLMKTMDEDREKLFRWGERCRKYFSSMCSYTNQQEKIFSFIDI